MSDQPTRNSQIDSEIETVAQKMGRVADLVDSLKVRLEPVTREDGQPPSPESDKAEQPLVPYAQRLRSINRTATKAVDELEHILNILEV